MNQPFAHTTENSTPRRRWHLLFIVILAVLMIGSNIKGSWRFDDPLIIQYVQTLPNFHSAFFDATLWRELGAPFFTPLLTLIFQLAYQLFGLNSIGHYFLHLLAILAIAVLTYAMVAPRSTPLGGVCAATLFLLGAPTSVVAAQLMATHYPWGLVLALLSIFMWQRFLKTRTWGWAAASAALYLLAMLNKEIFAPLPLVLFVLAWPRGWSAIFGLVGHAVAAIVYVPWRTAMIGSGVGGYGGTDMGLSMLASSIPTLAQSVWGQGLAAWVGASCALVLVIRALWVHGRPAIGLLVCALLGVLLPFGFVSATSEIVHLRLAFLPWWALCVCIGFAVSWPLPLRESGRKSRFLLAGWIWVPVVLLVFIVVQAQQRTQDQLAQETDVYDAYARHALAPPGAGWALLQGRAAADPHFQYGLWQMARREGVPETTVEAFAQQARHATGKATGYAYDPGCRCMALHRAAEPKAPLSPSQRIQTQFTAPATRGLQWQLTGSESGGTWYLQVPHLGITMLFTASGAIDFATPPWLLREEFRVVWRDVEGSWAETPLQNFPSRGTTVQF